MDTYAVGSRGVYGPQIDLRRGTIVRMSHCTSYRHGSGRWVRGWRIGAQGMQVPMQPDGKCYDVRSLVKSEIDPLA